MFGFQRRRVRRCECEMLLPKPGPLPQTSHVAATGDSFEEQWSRAHRRTRRSVTGQLRGSDTRWYRLYLVMAGATPAAPGNRSSVANAVGIPKLCPRSVPGHVPESGCCRCRRIISARVPSETHRRWPVQIVQDRAGAELMLRWSRVAVAALGDARAQLDALNVYPVPDTDTGTNL